MNILYLCNKKYNTNKMSRGRFHSMEALGKISNIHYSGIGWEDYDNNVFVNKNIKKIQKDNNIKFDFVIAYKPLEMKNFKYVGIPKCIRYNEMYKHKKLIQLDEITKSKSNLIICHHYNDYEKYIKQNLENVKFVYIGHGADKRFYKNYNLNKKYDVLLIGRINGYYPLRERFRDVIKAMKKLGFKCGQYKHPGYDVKKANNNKQVIKYAQAINKSKICLTSTGLNNHRFAKYIEIPMCHSAICGDIPGDKNQSDYQYVIKISKKSTVKEICIKLVKYLTDEKKLKEKTRLGVEYAKNYTHELYAEKLLNSLNSYLKI